MSNPLVSVVIPCYNHAQFVQDCIQSVIDQTYANIELIIIDDGSKDQSVAKIEEMLDNCSARFSRFEFRHRPNKGLSATLNEALEWCHGEYFSVIASDDMMLKDKTQVQVAYLLNSDDNVVGVFGGYHLIDNNNAIIRTVVKQKIIYSFDEIFLHNFDLPAPTAMLKLKNIIDVGRYAENLKIEDWYMWLKLTEKGQRLTYLSNVLVNYRYHDNNMSSNVYIMNDERLKVIKCFDYLDTYKLAELKIQWLKITDYLYVDKVKSGFLFLKLISQYPSQIFTTSLLRYFYHMIKSFYKKRI